MKRRPMSPGQQAKLKGQQKTLGRMIRNRRETQGISKIELGEILNIARDTVHRWERGMIDPNTTKLVMWLFDGGQIDEVEMWRARAFIAEAAVRDVMRALSEYNGALKDRSVR